LTRGRRSAYLLRAFPPASAHPEEPHASRAPLLERAKLLFVDAAKDGKMQQRFRDMIETVSFRTPPVIVFDDVRLRNGLGIWRGIRRPKLDLTLFAHWGSTGLIDWHPQPQR
jgi:hypothetical protein